MNLESEHQIALTAPKESKTYKNSINGVGKMTHRYTFTQIWIRQLDKKKIQPGCTASTSGLSRGTEPVIVYIRCNQLGKNIQSK